MSGVPSPWSTASTSLRREARQGVLFVSGLSPSIHRDQIDFAFGRFGEHSGVELIDLRPQQVSSMVGTITYRSASDAAEAVKGLNGTVLAGMPIQVGWEVGQLQAIAKWQQEVLQPRPPQQVLQHVKQSHQSPGSIASTSPAPTSPKTASSNVTLANDLTDMHEVWVGDLLPNCQDEDLARIFSGFASFKSARIMCDNTSHKCRGYGFVAFSNPSDAERAIAIMNGELLFGKPIKVNRAQDKPATATSPSNSTAARGDTRSLGLPPTAGLASGPLLSFETIRMASDLSNTTMYVGELPHTITEAKLTAPACKFGRVDDVRIQRALPRADGVTPKPFGFVKFDTHDNATKAIQSFGGLYIDGQMVKSGWAKDRPASQETRREGGQSSAAKGASFAPQASARQLQPHSQPQLYQTLSTASQYQPPPQQQLYQPQQLYAPPQQPQLPQYDAAAAYNAVSTPFYSSYPSAAPAHLATSFSQSMRSDGMQPHALPPLAPVPHGLPQSHWPQQHQASHPFL